MSRFALKISPAKLRQRVHLTTEIERDLCEARLLDFVEGAADRAVSITTQKHEIRFGGEHVPVRLITTWTFFLRITSIIP